MAYSRFFLSHALTSHDPDMVQLLSLTQEDLHHAVGVLRVTRAHDIAVVEPEGRAFLIRLKEVDKHALRGFVVRELCSDPLPDVTLVQGVSKGERMDLCVRMSVEVGVSGIVPVFTQRSIVKADHDKAASKAQRWSRIAQAAAKQSGRAAIPAIAEPRPFAETLPGLKAFDAVFVAWEEQSHGSLHHAVVQKRLDEDARVAVVVGPEGGLTHEEIEQLTAQGAITFTLGDTILRTETAGVIAASLVLYERGALGNRAQ